MQDEAPRKPLHSADKSVEEELAIPLNWEARLAEARERRKKALAERAASNEQNADTNATPSNPKKPRPAQPPQSDWDQRLAAARADRAKVLSERQGTEHVGYGASPKDFRLAKANADHQRSKQSAPKPVVTPRPESTEHAPNVVAMPIRPAAPQPVLVDATPSPVPFVDEQEDEKRVSTLPVVIFACFFGLGVGVAIGWGLFNMLPASGTDQVAASTETAPAEDVTRRASPTSEGIALTLPAVAPQPRPGATLAAAPEVVDSLASGTQSVIISENATVTPTVTGTTPNQSVQVASLGDAPVADAVASPAAPVPALIDNSAPQASDASPTLNDLETGANTVVAAVSRLSDVRRDTQAAPSVVLTSSSQDTGFIAPVPLVDLRNAVGLATPTLRLDTAEDTVPRAVPNIHRISAKKGVDELPATQEINFPLQLILDAPAAAPIVAALAAKTFSSPDASVSSPLSTVTLAPITRPASEVADLSTIEIASLNWSLPQIGEPPQQLDMSFVQSLGLSASEAQRFGVYLFAPGSITDGDVSEYQSRLSGTGLDLKLTKRVEFKISKTQIRFYTEGDRRMATRLADELGIIARDFTANGGNGGRIEVWMQGEAGAAAPKPKRTTRNTTSTRRAKPQPVDTRTRLTNSIIEQLRSK